MIFWIWYGASLFLLIAALGWRIFKDLRELKKEQDRIFNYEFDEETTDDTAPASTGERQRIDKNQKL